MIGDFLYQLSPRDSFSQGMLFHSREVGLVAGAQTTIIVELFQVPFESVFIPMAWNWGATPGAGQRINQAYIRAVSEDGSQFIIFDLVEYRAVGVDVPQGHARAQHGALVIPPGFRIAVVGIFNAGAASNAMGGRLIGYTVPRGNLGMP